MAIFSSGNYFNIVNEAFSNEISSFNENDFYLSAKDVQRICNNLNSNRSLLEDYIIEVAAPKSDFSKLGIKNSSQMINKASKEIANTIKKNGATPETKKQIHNIVSDLFQEFADNIDAAVIAQNPGLKKCKNKRNTQNALVLFIYILTISVLVNSVLTILMPAVGGTIYAIIGAPIIEEASKSIAVKGGFEKEYMIVFNSYEFTSYVVQMTAIGIPIIDSILLRGAVVGMHNFTTYINKLFSTEEFRKKFKIKDTKDAKDQATLCAYTIGTLIHVSWNSASCLVSMVL